MTFYGWFATVSLEEVRGRAAAWEARVVRVVARLGLVAFVVTVLFVAYHYASANLVTRPPKTPNEAGPFAPVVWGMIGKRSKRRRSAWRNP